MQCVHCDYPESSVISTRTNDMKKLIERRRECKRCGKRYTTHERLRESSFKTSPPLSVLPPK